MSREAKFSRITLVEIEAGTLNVAPVLKGRGAFSDEMGRTYGEFRGYTWSRETLEALTTLRTLMEKDMENIAFVSDSSTTMSSGLTSSTSAASSVKEEEVKGMGSFYDDRQIGDP